MDLSNKVKQYFPSGKYLSWSAVNGDGVVAVADDDSAVIVYNCGCVYRGHYSAGTVYGEYYEPCITHGN